MSTESKETLYELTDLDDEDLWVRGQVYVRHKRLLVDAEECTAELERNVARARYEYEITQRVGAKITDSQAQENWKTTESVAHDLVMMAEHELAEAAKNTAYHHAMVTEMEADLGDKAQKYLEILIAFEWVEEDWEEEYFDEFVDFEELDGESDSSDSIPF
ncbi:MAG: hypothetical protein GY832_07795 [Chloroflexi bacterium]|nr:hypothetical protein [Chloroflexota bacterium]